MEPTFHEIDPSGDTLLILHNANAPFAVLPSPTPQEQQKESDSAPDDKSEKDWQDTDSEPEDEESKPEDANSESKDAKNKPTIRMRLSSKHLILASAYFKKMTANNWKETTPEAGYSYVINTQDWDEHALLVVMSIIHGRTAKVPRQLKLEMLAKIAVLVDYYQCHEVVGFFAQTWLTESSLRLVGEEDEGERNHMLRLVVSMVFPENHELSFWYLTEKIIQMATGPIDSLGLPIRQDVIDALNERREKVILGVIHGLYTLKTRLCDDETSCSFECSSISLGALYKAMKKMNLTDTPPSRPYPGLRLETLVNAVFFIRDPSWKSNCRCLSAPATSSSTTTTKTSTTTTTPSTAPLKKTAAPPPAKAAPVPSRPLFGGPPLAQPTNTAFTFHPPTAAPINPFAIPPSSSPAELPKIASIPSVQPACNLTAKTKPIVDGLLGGVGGLELEDFVKVEWNLPIC